jgi:hypothetical protein
MMGAIGGATPTIVPFSLLGAAGGRGAVDGDAPAAAGPAGGGAAPGGGAGGGAGVC